MGKSGQIGRKFASTLTSTGRPAVFLHPAESSHGDLGLIDQSDIVVGISYAGETAELADVLRFCARKDVPVIAITGSADSTLAQAARVVLNISVKEEACPLGLAPTTSSTATLALTDALAMAVLRRRGLSESDFAELHPGGSLGRRLLTRVEDVMHTGDAVPLVRSETAMREVIGIMTRGEVRGVAGVIDAEGSLIGVITDGDIRRRLEKSLNPLEEKALDLMSRSPKLVDAAELAEKSAFMMEQFSIQFLFVVRSQSEQPRRPVGVLRLHDLLKHKLR
jgi:arabinose-5-phosphate isomerase